MFRTTLVVLAAMACAQARPQNLQLPAFPSLQFPSTSSGQSNAGITQGQTVGPAGTSTITQQQAGTGGAASGGGFNTGKASAGQTNFSGLFGSGSDSKTNAESNQGTNPFGTFPVIPGFPTLGGSAQGNAASTLTQGKTVGPAGTTTITQLGSSAGGSAQGGGSNVSKASGQTTSVDTGLGSQTTSNIDSQSTQLSGR